MRNLHEMPCCDLVKHLSDLRDGELSPELTDLILEHLENCDNCRIVVNTLNKTIDLCQEGTELIHLPEDVHNRLLAKLDLDDK
jgi:predicted anti-sigma-YlaC factor YlaD